MLEIIKNEIQNALAALDNVMTEDDSDADNVGLAELALHRAIDVINKL